MAWGISFYRPSKPAYIVDCRILHDFIGITFAAGWAACLRQRLCDVRWCNALKQHSALALGLASLLHIIHKDDDRTRIMHVAPRIIYKQGILRLWRSSREPHSFTLKPRNPSIYNMIPWIQVLFFFFIKSCEILCKNPFNLFFIFL